MKRTQHQKMLASKSIMEENWIEITCNSQINGFKQINGIDENKNQQNNENLKKNSLNSNNQKRSFSIRIFLDEMRLFYWAHPILKAPQVKELEINSFQGESQSSKVVLLGNFFFIFKV